MEKALVARLQLGVALFVAGLALNATFPSLAKAVERSSRPAKSPSVNVAGGSKRATVHASWYGPAFHGRRAASARLFNANDFTAAHRSLRFGTKLEVTNPRNGRQVIVEVTDRGPYVRGRDLDLSYAAARELGIVRAGVARLQVRVLGEEATAFDSTKVLVVASAVEGIGGVWPRAIVR